MTEVWIDSTLPWQFVEVSLFAVVCLLFALVIVMFGPGVWRELKSWLPSDKLRGPWSAGSLGPESARIRCAPTPARGIRADHASQIREAGERRRLKAIVSCERACQVPKVVPFGPPTKRVS